MHFWQNIPPELFFVLIGAFPPGHLPHQPYHGWRNRLAGSLLPQLFQFFGSDFHIDFLLDIRLDFQFMELIEEIFLASVSDFLFGIPDGHFNGVICQGIDYGNHVSVLDQTCGNLVVLPSEADKSVLCDFSGLVQLEGILKNLRISHSADFSVPLEGFVR